MPIASDIGGCGEIVLPDINGYLIEMNNIDMFVNKIKVLDKNRLLMYLGKNGRKLVEKNFKFQMLLKIICIYINQNLFYKSYILLFSTKTEILVYSIEVDKDFFSLKCALSIMR